MSRSSLALSYFERIKSQRDPGALLRSLVNVNPPTFEEEWLDFKCQPNDNDTKKIWSKALSGFANTEGGVLIWGIDCRKDKNTGIDAASSFCLLDNPAQLISRLNELTHQATDPPVTGVEQLSIEDPHEAPKGYVVSLVPESEFKPHRAELVTNKPYYHRVTDNFVIVNPALLRSLFYPQVRSMLEVVAIPSFSDYKFRKTDDEARVDVRIENLGPATAREIAIRFSIEMKGNYLSSKVQSREWWRTDVSPDAPPVVGSFAFEITDSVNSFISRGSLSTSHPLHPDAEFVLFTIQFTARPLQAADLTIVTEVFAADRERQVFRVVLNSSDIRNGIEKKAVLDRGTES